MKHIEYLNGLIRSNVARTDNCVLFGQNIDAGSCLGGLTRNIKVNPGSKIFNSTNAENSLAGFGFGLMMNGSNGVFLMKQLDFLLLSIDHLVNTYNIIRSIKDKYPEGSFTIVATVVDSGYDGPQSSFNNFYDLCSIARADGFTVTNKTDADLLFSKQFLQPGFRVIALSQRLCKEELIETAEPLHVSGNGNVFQYKEGKDATVVSFNFSYPQASGLVSFLGENNIAASHYNVSNATNSDWERIIADVAKTKRVIIIDDSKSIQAGGENLLSQLCGMQLDKKIVLKRTLNTDWLYPVSDVFEINHNKILKEW